MGRAPKAPRVWTRQEHWCLQLRDQEPREAFRRLALQDHARCQPGRAAPQQPIVSYPLNHSDLALTQSLIVSQTQAYRLLQVKGHPRNRLLLPRFHRFTSLQEREAEEARRVKGQVCAAGSSHVGSSARYFGHSQVCYCDAHSGQL